jgi:hypothetical protein
MSKVFVGKGDSTGMAFRAPAGTALPNYPGASLSADWVACGNVGEDGISMKLPSGDVIRNWALDPERKNNTEPGQITVPFIHTTKATLETLVGENNVTYVAANGSHGNLTSVEFAPDVSAEPAAYLFLMKDGDTRAFVGSSNALISDIADVSFNGADPTSWNATIDGTWTTMFDDGAVASGS